MTDTYADFAALAAAESPTAYSIRSVPVTGATWAAIAIHGGGIEPGSGEMARYVAAGRMAHYEFAALLSSGNSRLHITSTNFDEPTGLAVVAAARRCLSFHGAAGDPGVPMTFLGGLDTVTGARVAARLRAAGFTVTMASEELNANSTSNITNKTTLSAGVQLEMSNALRASFFPNGDLSRTMRDSGARTPAFYAYAAAVISAVAGEARMSQGSVNVSRWALVPSAYADVDVSAQVGTDALAAGGAHFVALAARAADTNNCYLARLAFNTDQTITLTLRERVAGTETALATATVPGLTHAAGARYGLRFKIAGSSLMARVWPVGYDEPQAWQTTATDTSLTAAGSVGMRSILSTANTNSLPVVASYGAFQQSTPQRAIVARAVNGISKGQPAGAAVALADPTYIGL